MMVARKIPGKWSAGAKARLVRDALVGHGVGETQAIGSQVFAPGWEIRVTASAKVMLPGDRGVRVSVLTYPTRAHREGGPAVGVAYVRPTPGREPEDVPVVLRLGDVSALLADQQELHRLREEIRRATHLASNRRTH